jgi:hydroxymethylglutaryl-CoA reductase
MIAQISYFDIDDFTMAYYSLKSHKKEIIDYANKSCENMVVRGGGVEDLRFRNIESEILIVELLVNVQDCMGANAVNQIAEFTAPYI